MALEDVVYTTTVWARVDTETGSVFSVTVDDQSLKLNDGPEQAGPEAVAIAEKAESWPCWEFG